MTTSTHAPPPRSTRTFADTFALLAECLLVGIYVLVASLPVVTLPAALAAGTAHLRRHLAGRGTDIGRFARDWWDAVRALWLLGVAGVVLAAVLGVNAQIAASGMLPGGAAVRGASLAAGAVAAVVVLRTAGAWPRLGDGAWGTARGLVAGGMRDAGKDPAGSLLLLVALGLCGLLVWMLTPLIAVVGGLLCLAVVAVEARAGTRPRRAAGGETTRTGVPAGRPPGSASPEA
ncbi:hypothetical protein [Myceligenerans indicum]|uniref:hypothetical protein n=1 Tax=Myceligenerans indicum TaxID=2593663 RepID=UPI00191F9B04|nr:hypothetical protein [Myceligenerans indicum]